MISHDRSAVRTSSARRGVVALCAAALLGACGGADAEEGAERPAPIVRAAAVQTERFVDRIEAVGTAIANEQVTLSAPVTERIVRLNFDDGQFVTRGQVLAVLASGQEGAELSDAQARAREAGQQLSRLQELRERGFATVSSVDSQTALASSARAQAASAQASIADRVVRAPFGGYVSLRNISAGAVVSAGTEIATVSDLSRIKLDFAVPETLLASIRPGQPIEALAAAYGGEPFRGTIDSIDPVINPATRAVTVRAVLPNPGARLKPGMLLSVTIEASSRSAPAVPELAVIGEGNDSFVFVVEDGVAQRRQVRVGLRQEGRVEIVQGLSPGDRIVSEGVVKVTDGQRVRLAGPDNARPQTAQPAPPRPATPS